MLSDDVIYLRKLETDDLERTWTWINDPSVYLKIGSQVPISRSAQLKWFESMDQATDKIVLAICLKDGNTHVGNVSLDSVENRHRTARLSVFVGDERQRGKSIGSRAIRLLAGYAFDFLNLNKIWCKAAAGEERIVRFYEAMGFRVEGLLRQHEFLCGKYVDKVLLGLIRSDFHPPS